MFGIISFCLHFDQFVCLDRKCLVESSKLTHELLLLHFIRASILPFFHHIPALSMDTLLFQQIFPVLLFRHPIPFPLCYPPSLSLSLPLSSQVTGWRLQICSLCARPLCISCHLHFPLFRPFARILKLLQRHSLAFPHCALALLASKVARCLISFPGFRLRPLRFSRILPFSLLFARPCILRLPVSFSHPCPAALACALLPSARMLWRLKQRPFHFPLHCRGWLRRNWDSGSNRLRFYPRRCLAAPVARAIKYLIQILF
mmetsp:Transcript_56486/g.91433  ORF Transcript_56486/g.91433 Transcript_56486/m.91433 type:complete len:259 (-) Transcript_56486:343-1119(-)